MDFKNSIDLKFLWAQNNRANSITQVYMDGKLVEHPPHIPLRVHAFYFESSSSPQSIAFALCCELYGEDLAFQVYPWFGLVIDKLCRTKEKQGTIDLTAFNKRHFSNIHYYDVEATVAWYSEPLVENMRQDRLTARYQVKNVPIVDHSSPVSMGISNAEVERRLRDYITRKGRSPLMKCNFTIDNISYTLPVVAKDALVKT